MSVIAELSVPGDDFGLGRVLEVVSGISIELESMVPMGETAIPFLWVHDSHRDSFTANLAKQEVVSELTEIDALDGKTLYALEWDGKTDELFRGIQQLGAQVLNATGTPRKWEFELRFPDHETLSDFQRYCQHHGITLDVRRIYNPTRPDSGPWFGLTPVQRETLLLATERGYYDIPRQCTTLALAEELGVSDQAVTERLRRAIVTLVSNTVQYPAREE
ncbi:helix-turn-helix domain-containing protein [Halalkalicoccus jeotgali]|uniref:Bacterio-opsin activator HTH domain protein n=1 Tax=Halalkalicoccus jeotgali (strain DSM 18796 / CECT 7217 / JCM 14584 / KCTC 4019 / B3) TaxID=795797 RepID=D8J9T3_HALJB|nr:helix-turn-helix domain-containing protein [Halalkalicoccus jeotgali]ADJ16422.1 Bacterio-opsin activator HTH domain protein [Halalkalicoccus jeotgali B3]ELY37156.1 bacterio-opsin activator HTH domain-containing protein [Halalkalicoccus jeotgali B3]